MSNEALAGLLDDHTVAQPTTYAVTSLADGVEILSDRVIRLDQKLARKFTQLTTFVGERPIREDHVEYLVAALKRGTFLEEAVILATAVMGDEDVSIPKNGLLDDEYRINGQHTSWAVLSMPENFSMKVRHIRYRVKDEEYLRVLYSSIDRGAARTQSNLIVAQLAGAPGFSSLKQDYIRRLSEGMGLHVWPSGHHRRLHDANDRAHLLTGEWRNVALKIGKFLQESTSETVRHMLRSPVIAAMFATYRVSQKDAEAFWTTIRDGTNIKSKNDPRLRLRNFLMNTGIADRGSSVARKKIPTEQMYRHCIHCWNAYREGEELQVLRAPVKTQIRPTAK